MFPLHAGIGPTHDDVTYEALAAAFNAKLELHQPTVERMKVEYAKRGVELNAARLRMATLPAPSGAPTYMGIMPIVLFARLCWERPRCQRRQARQHVPVPIEP